MYTFSPTIIFIQVNAQPKWTSSIFIESQPSTSCSKTTSMNPLTSDKIVPLVKNVNISKIKEMLFDASIFSTNSTEIL